MATDTAQQGNPIRDTSAQAIRLAKSLMRSAKFGALAVIEPVSKDPFVSRVAVATTMNGAPLILVSALSTHTQALRADPRCSLLLGEPEKGDPLAYPRVTLQCEAEFLERDSTTGLQARDRYLRRNPKGKLYADFGDFSFVKLNPTRAALNGGFGQAFRVTSADLLCDSEHSTLIEHAETDILHHMNTEHQNAVQSIGTFFSEKTARKWRLTGVDPDGIDISGADKSARIWFDLPANSINSVRLKLMDLAARSRKF
jgi:heme iron utilization protein